MGFNARSELMVSGLAEFDAGLIPEPVLLIAAGTAVADADVVDLLSVVAQAPSASADSRSETRQNWAMGEVVFIKTCFSIHAGWQRLVRHPVLSYGRHAPGGIGWTGGRWVLCCVKKG